MTKDQFARLLSNLERGRYPPALALTCRICWATGARPSEVAGSPAIPKSRQRFHPGLHREDILGHQRFRLFGKNTKPGATSLKEREVFVADTQLYREVVSLARERDKIIPVQSNELQWALWRARKTFPAELRGFSFRWLRHSHAIHAIQNGVDIVSLGRQLGHASIAMTANVYLKYATRDDKKFLAAFEQKPPEVQWMKLDCPGCGFVGEVRDGRWTTESRMGAAMRRS